MEKEKNFKGWNNTVEDFLKNQTKKWSAKELAEFYEPNNPTERDKIRWSIGHAMSWLKSRGVLMMERQGRDGYFGMPHLFPPPEDKKANTPAATGLVPRQEYHKRRIDDIVGAVLHCFDNQRPMPLEWIEEYNELIKLIKK